MTIVFSIFLGACIGSFLNVCLYRWKSGKNVVFPPSFCPSCHRPILWVDNIPIISFFLLEAKCRFCHKAISWQYPIIETLTALFFGLSYLFFKDNVFSIVASFFFVSFLVLLAVGDFKWRLLPHPFNNLFIVAGIMSHWNFSSLVFMEFFKGACNFIFIGSALYIATLIIPKGLGGGDIKMASALAIWLGLPKSFFSLLMAFGVGSLVVVPLFFLKKKKVTHKTMIPFGPFLASSSLFLWFCPKVFSPFGVDL